MDKTISISLGGYAFILDEAAYQKLKRYLDQVRMSLRETEGVDEIMTDVEIRLAELLSEKRGKAEVVNEVNVNEVIAIMGEPNDYASDDDETSDKTQSFTFDSDNTGNKRLFRDPDDKVLSGLSSGIAHYFGTDPVLIRIIWILLSFVMIPFNIVAYIIMWLIVPEANTTGDRFAMRGKNANFNTIRENATEATKEMGSKANSFLTEFFKIVVTLFKFLFAAILVMFGISLVVGGISIFFVSIFSNHVLNGMTDIFIEPGIARTILTILLPFLFIIPGIFLIILGIRLFGKRYKFDMKLAGSLGIIWILSMIGFFGITAFLAQDFQAEATISEEKEYAFQQDTLQVNFMSHNMVDKQNRKVWFNHKNHNDNPFLEYQDEIYVNDFIHSVELRKSDNDKVKVEIIYLARGKNNEQALDNISNISYQYDVDNLGNLNFNDYFKLAKNKKFRAQDVDIIIYLPEGKVLKSNIRNIHSEKFAENHWHYDDDKGKFFTFVGETLDCLNCEENKDEDQANQKVRIEVDGKEIDLDHSSITIQKDGETKVEIKNNKTSANDTVNLDSIN